MQENEQNDDHVEFHSHHESENNEEAKEDNEWADANNNAIHEEEAQQIQPIGDYSFIAEDGIEDIDPNQNRQEIFSFRRDGDKCWFRDQASLDALNDAISERKRELKEILKDNPAEFGKQIVRYCINKRAFLFLKDISGNNNAYFMELLEHCFIPCHFTKISEIYVNGIPYQSFYMAKRNRSKEHVEFTLKDINEIRIWFYIPIEEANENQPQLESRLLVMRQVLCSFIKCNLFPDILHTLGHLIWQKNKNNV